MNPSPRILFVPTLVLLSLAACDSSARRASEAFQIYTQTEDQLLPLLGKAMSFTPEAQRTLKERGQRTRLEMQARARGNEMILLCADSMSVFTQLVNAAERPLRDLEGKKALLDQSRQTFDPILQEQIRRRSLMAAHLQKEMVEKRRRSEEMARQIEAERARLGPLEQLRPLIEKNRQRILLLAAKS